MFFSLIAETTVSTCSSWTGIHGLCRISRSQRTIFSALPPVSKNAYHNSSICSISVWFGALYGFDLPLLISCKYRFPVLSCCLSVLCVSVNRQKQMIRSLFLPGKYCFCLWNRFCTTRIRNRFHCLKCRIIFHIFQFFVIQHLRAGLYHHPWSTIDFFSHRQRQIYTHKAAHIPAKAQHPSVEEHKSSDQQYHISETTK